jgi:hypothetical protein
MPIFSGVFNPGSMAVSAAIELNAGKMPALLGKNIKNCQKVLVRDKNPNLSIPSVARLIS